MPKDNKSSSRPLLRDVMKREYIFLPQEAKLPLVMLARPYNGVLLGRVLVLWCKYLRLLLLYAYHKYKSTSKKKRN